MFTDPEITFTFTIVNGRTFTFTGTVTNSNKFWRGKAPPMAVTLRPSRT
jgi:hypothetical protein